MEGNDLGADLAAFWSKHSAELIEFRSDLHAHPELANAEHRTTRRGALRLAAAGLRPVILPTGPGLSARPGPPTSARGRTRRTAAAGRWSACGPTSTPCPWPMRRTCPTARP